MDRMTEQLMNEFRQIYRQRYGKDPSPDTVKRFLQGKGNVAKSSTSGSMRTGSYSQMHGNGLTPPVMMRGTITPGKVVSARANSEFGWAYDAIKQQRAVQKEIDKRIAARKKEERTYKRDINAKLAKAEIDARKLVNKAVSDGEIIVPEETLKDPKKLKEFKTAIVNEHVKSVEDTYMKRGMLGGETVGQDATPGMADVPLKKQYDPKKNAWFENPEVGAFGASPSGGPGEKSGVKSGWGKITLDETGPTGKKGTEFWTDPKGRVIKRVPNGKDDNGEPAYDVFSKGADGEWINQGAMAGNKLNTFVPSDSSISKKWGESGDFEQDPRPARAPIDIPPPTPSLDRGVSDILSAPEELDDAGYGMMPGRAIYPEDRQPKERKRWEEYEEKGLAPVGKLAQDVYGATGDSLNAAKDAWNKDWGGRALEPDTLTPEDEELMRREEEEQALRDQMLLRERMSEWYGGSLSPEYYDDEYGII